MWKVAYLTPTSTEWRTYYADEARAREIADSMAKRYGWKIKQMIRW